MSDSECKYKLYTIEQFFISKSVYAPKQISKTGLLTGLKIALIDQTKKVAFVATPVPAYAGKLTTHAGKSKESFDSS